MYANPRCWAGYRFATNPLPGLLPEGTANAVFRVRDAVATDAAGDGDVGIFGADLARQCPAAGLLDEIVTHVVPTPLGGRVRLFEGRTPVRLRKTRCDDSAQIADLLFEVVRGD